MALALARDRFLPGADRDDTRQEALLALWVAARNYDPERGPFAPFATVVVRRRLATAVKRSTERSQRVLTEAFRVLDDTEAAHTVEELVEAREQVRRFTRATTRLTALERRAIIRCANGESGRDDDNALYRAKAKVRQQLSLLGEPHG